MYLKEAINHKKVFFEQSIDWEDEPQNVYKDLLKTIQYNQGISRTTLLALWFIYWKHGAYEIETARQSIENRVELKSFICRSSILWKHKMCSPFPCQLLLGFESKGFWYWHKSCEFSWHDMLIKIPTIPKWEGSKVFVVSYFSSILKVIPITHVSCGNSLKGVRETQL